MVGYAIRSLTSAERNYCHLENKILSVVFVCHRFHEFISGKNLCSCVHDHLPLQSIFKRSILKALPCIQRFLLQLKRYDLEMHYI